MIRGCKSFIILGLREGFFIACITLGKKERDKFDEQRDIFNKAMQKLYDETAILHDGMWLGFDIYDASFNEDLFRLMQIKRKPNRKILPESMEKCGVLAIGMSQEEITKLL